VASDKLNNKGGNPAKRNPKTPGCRRDIGDRSPGCGRAT